MDETEPKTLAEIIWEHGKVLDAIKAKADKAQRQLYDTTAAAYRAQGYELLQQIVKPFCDAYAMGFHPDVIGWEFRYTTGPYAGKEFPVGRERRAHPDNPGGLEGIKTQWWLPITAEEHALRNLLDTLDSFGHPVGRWVPIYLPYQKENTNGSPI